VTHAQSAPDGCHVEILDRAGHMVQMEHAGTVNRLLLEHFATA
jgi:pimeloyl-ACP methyl ester carboxylesterase